MFYELTAGYYFEKYEQFTPGWDLITGATAIRLPTCPGMATPECLDAQRTCRQICTTSNISIDGFTFARTSNSNNLREKQSGKSIFQRRFELYAR